MRESSSDKAYEAFLSCFKLMPECNFAYKRLTLQMKIRKPRITSELLYIRSTFATICSRSLLKQ